MLPLRDNVPTRRFPVVTVALIVINVAVWLLYQLPNLDRSVHDLAFHPCEVNGSCAADRQGLAADRAHLDVHARELAAHRREHAVPLDLRQQRRGRDGPRSAILVFYFLGGFAATALQTLVTFNWGQPGDALVPNLGASGAISAVLGAYLVLLPTARVLTLVFYFFIQVPAYFFLGFWILFQLWQGGFSRHPARGAAAASRSSPTSAGSPSASLTVKPVQGARRPSRPTSACERGSRSTCAPRSTRCRRSSRAGSRTSRSSSRSRTRRSRTSTACSTSRRTCRREIAIYRRPLVEDFGDDPAALEEEIRVTVLHELAHYFGIDEDRLDELGYA